MDKEELFRVLQEEWSPRYIREDEFSVTEVMNALSAVGRPMSREYAIKKLNLMVENGILQMENVRRRGIGGRCNAYSPAEGKSWEDVLQYIKQK